MMVEPARERLVERQILEQLVVRMGLIVTKQEQDVAKRTGAGQPDRFEQEMRDHERVVAICGDQYRRLHSSR